MSCLSEYAVDHLVAGEPREGTAEHVASCTACAARVVVRRAERAEFGATAPALRPPPARRGWQAWAAVPAALAVAAAATLLVHRQGGTRLKGGVPQVTAFVRHDGKVRLAAPRETVAPGDGVQLTVSATAERRHVAVIGIDGTGGTTIYRPAAPVEPGIDVPLDFSIVLDDVPGEERLLVFFCDGPAAVTTALAPDGCTVRTVSVVKP